MADDEVHLRVGDHAATIDWSAMVGGDAIRAVDVRAGAARGDEAVLTISTGDLHPGDTLRVSGRCSAQFSEPNAYVRLSQTSVGPSNLRQAAGSDGSDVFDTFPTSGTDHRFDGELLVAAEAPTGQWSASLLCVMQDMTGEGVDSVPFTVWRLSEQLPVSGAVSRTTSSGRQRIPGAQPSAPAVTAGTARRATGTGVSVATLAGAGLLVVVVAVAGATVWRL